MKGIHRIIVQNKRVRYDFELRRNITVVRGDSATGKTTLIEMIREYANNGASSSIELICDKACFILDGSTWQGQLAVMKDSIVFIDEGNSFILTNEFASSIQKTDNYYVIVTRESLPNLPYSVEEIYGIRLSGKYGHLKQVYNEFYQLYGKQHPLEEIRPDILMSEDSNSGYQFFSGVVSDDIICISANGKSNILTKLKTCTPDKLILVIADGAAFGPEMNRITLYMHENNNIRLFLPESFEWLILDSGLINSSELTKILTSPSDYIESSEYFSWERFFTHLLIDLTKDNHLQYSKSKLNASYLSNNVKNLIIRGISNIQLTI
ncbi:MAG: translation initiation factor 2 [Proteobacteria bacterium]|nr:translation initiation factor 2 [Pseudomonadota bacterium]